jgi:hypothetical protein
MKKLALALSFLLLAACPALAQVNPWFQNGASLSPYDPTVGITVPSTVTGGNKGPGTGNFSNLYINGVAVQGFGNEPRNTVLAGPLSGADAQPTFRGLTSADLPAGTGTVTSVGLTLPSSIFIVTVSPITTTGSLTATLANQSANTFFGGATSGGSATPAFRALVAADIPAIDASTVTNLSVATIAALEALTTRPSAVTVAGYNAANDNGGGSFSWVASDTTTVDGCTVFAPSGGGASGRWHRVFFGLLTPKQCGATGNGTTNDLAALNYFWAAVSNGIPGYVIAGTYNFTAPLTALTPSGNVSVGGDGPLAIFSYGGASTTPGNLWSLTCSIVTQQVSLKGFTFTSSTTLASSGSGTSSGWAMNINACGWVDFDVILTNTNATPTLWNGAWFNANLLTNLNYTQVTALHDGITATSNTEFHLAHAVGKGTLLGPTVTGVSSGTGGVFRLAVSSTTGFTTGSLAFTTTIGGLPAISNGAYIITVGSGYIELNGTTYTSGYTSGGEVYQGSGTPFHFAGANGGVYGENATELFGNIGFLVDQSLVATANSNFFAGSATADTNVLAGWRLNDTSLQTFNGQLAWMSSSTNGVGLDVVASGGAAGSINLPGGTFLNNNGPGISFTDTAVTARIGTGVEINSNTYGVSAASAMNIYTTNTPINNTIAAYHNVTPQPSVLPVAWSSITGTPTTLAGYGIASPLPVSQGGDNCSAASGTCLDNITGFSSTGFIKRTGAGTYTFTADPSDVTSVFGRTGAVVAASNDYNFNQLAGNYTLAQGPTIAANTVLGETASGTPIALSMPSCSASNDALIWTTGTGFGCNSSINAATLGGATFASPGTIGGTTPGVASFTTLNGSGQFTLTGTSTTGGHFLMSDTAGDVWQIGPGAGTGVATELNIYNQGSTTTVFHVDRTGDLKVPGTITAGLTNVATTSAVCFNTSTGLESYDGTLGTCNTSDETLKKFTGHLADSLSKLVALSQEEKFGRFRWIDPDKYGQGDRIGVGAQTLQRYFPEMVERGSDGLYSAAYDKLAIPLIDSVAALKLMNDNLNSRIAKLEAANDNLVAQMETLKQRISK